jgi:hypothetical protein
MAEPGGVDAQTEAYFALIPIPAVGFAHKAEPAQEVRLLHIKPGESPTW